MTLQIDTTFKIIKVLDQNVKIRELITELAKLFPEEEFMEYSLDVGSIPWGQSIYDKSAWLTTSPSLNPPWGPTYGADDTTLLTKLNK